MQWENPIYLQLLWLTPFLIALLVYRHKRRVAAARRFASTKMLDRLAPPLELWRPWLKGIAVVVAMVLLVFAAARPRFGLYITEVAHRGADVFVVMDVSKSMMAEDVKPSRLKRAKTDVRDLIRELEGDRVGLVAFAGNAVIKSPLTSDIAFFEMMLDDLSSKSAPLGGTNIAEGLEKAISSLEAAAEDGRDRAIVLITDGDDLGNPDEVMAIAKIAKQKNIKIFTVGLGNRQEGARIPVRDEHGNLNYMQYANKEIWSKMNESLLKKIADTTGGVCILAGTSAYDLGQLYEDRLAKLTQTEIKTEKREKYHEQYQLFASLGLIFMMIQMAVPAYRKVGHGKP
ncbi:MAG: VWA domain-containing protein [Planctomycetia bacterium]|jgi:Ca-activated chloride channel family protein